ncbi:Retinol dehydrogenase 14 [Halotydeus destructor]|nr:Retinol dehydrogenase 14 [Halotydeus destructor]
MMEEALWTLVCLVSLCSLVRLYFSATTGWYRGDRRLDGKVAIVTGANTGIGLETARDLVRRGARVVLACRSVERATEAAKDIVASGGNAGAIRVMQVDIASLKSVRAFCHQFVTTEQRLDILVLNAGMVPPPGKYLTEDNIELQFAANHLGHFLMTRLLMDILTTSGASRVIAVSSLLHHFGSIDLDNMANYEKSVPDPSVTYSATKLANVLMVKELTRRYTAHNGVTFNALHPGLVRTQINRQTPWYIKNFLQPLAYMWAKDSVAGAQTTIYLAVDSSLDHVSGQYFADCKQVPSSKLSNDEQLATKLWSLSEHLCDLGAV